MYQDLKVYSPGFLAETEKVEVHRFRTLPKKTRLVFSKKQSLKRQVWQNARKNGWLQD